MTSRNARLETLVPVALNTLRQDQGLTVPELAAAAGMTPAELSQVLTGDVSPLLSEYVALCAVLGVTPHTPMESMGGDPQTPQNTN